MVIGDRLRQLREAREMSQGDIEHKTGLLRCYISRVENGHTVPAIETLEKIARALDVQLYELFIVNPPKGLTSISVTTGTKLDRVSEKVAQKATTLGERDRKLLLKIAGLMQPIRRVA